MKVSGMHYCEDFYTANISYDIFGLDARGAPTPTKAAFSEQASTVYF